MFPKMTEIVPPGESGNVKITHYEVTPAESQFSSLRRGEYTSAGTYVVMKIDGGVMMSDTRNERVTNYDVVWRSKGHVFIAGLGIGMILHSIAKKSEVTKITVLENNPNVIKLISPTLPEKVEVIEGDVFEYQFPKELKFDTIYFDIWPNITTDNLPEMGRLHRRFRRNLAEGGWIDSWCRDMLKSRLRQERREEKRYGW